MIRKERILKEFTELVSIDAPSFGEKEMAAVLKKKLEELGFSVREDDVAEKIRGNAGNIYAFLEGNPEAEPLLLCAHMDTVEPSHGKQAVIQDDGRITSGGDTVLGGDDLCGVTEILEAIRHLKEEGLSHHPVEILFTVAEEAFSKGSKAYDYEGTPFLSKEVYVIDMSGHPGAAAIQAPSIIGWTAEVKGKAAHAGFAPENGINAIHAAASAIAKLTPGRVDPDMTMNVGTISGGRANNIVPDSCVVTGEVRSLDHEKAQRQIDQIRNIFEEQAGTAEVIFHAEDHVIAYHTPEDLPVVRRFKRACDKLGLPGKAIPTLGGSDNNILALHGLSGIVLSCGMQQVHSTREYTDINDMTQGAALIAEILKDPT